MSKIALIIDSCIDCQHLVKAQTNSSNNKINVAICGFPTEDQDAFLLFYSEHESIMNYAMDVPEHCPLEDYSGTQNILKNETD